MNRAERKTTAMPGIIREEIARENPTHTVYEIESHRRRPAMCLYADGPGDRRQYGETAKAGSGSANNTLQQLYESDPAAKAAVRHAAGYAVFNNMGVKILFAGSGRGKGIAVDNKTKKDVFMKMIQLQAGLGIGVEKFAVIFVFENAYVLNNFINSGWEFGGQANASAKTTTKGGAMAGAASVSDGVWMYQMTEKGLAAEITATGTKYYKDDELN